MARITQMEIGICAHPRNPRLNLNRKGAWYDTRILVTKKPRRMAWVLCFAFRRSKLDSGNFVDLEQGGAGRAGAHLDRVGAAWEGGEDGGVLAADVELEGAGIGAGDGDVGNARNPVVIGAEGTVFGVVERHDGIGYGVSRVELSEAGSDAAEQNALGGVAARDDEAADQGGTAGAGGATAGDVDEP